METQYNNNNNGTNPKVFGIIGLIIGIFSVILSIIPCIGYLAMIPAFFGLVLGIIGFSQSKQQGQKVGVSLAALIISIVGLGIGATQYFVFKEVIEAPSQIEDAIFETIIDAQLDSLEKESIEAEALDSTEVISE